MNAWSLSGTNPHSNKRIVLISPDTDSDFQAIGQRRGRIVRESLGLVHLASMLEHHGWKFQPAEQLTRLPETKGVTVGISVQLNNYHQSIEIAEQAKAAGAEVVLGGPYASVKASQILQRQPAVDYVVAGQGELPLLQYLEHSDGLQPRQVITQHLPMEQLPPRNRHLWPASSATFDGRALSLAYWAEGCPIAMRNPCLFCSIYHTPTASRRSVPQVISEMRELAHQGYGALEIGSDDFPGTVSNKWLTDLVQRMEEERLHFSVFTHAGVRSLKDRKLELLKGMGASILQVGLESANPKHKEADTSKATIEEEDDLIRRCKAIGIKLQVSLIVGFPGETELTMNATLERAAKLASQGVLAGIQIDPLIPLPGSRAYVKLSATHPDLADTDYTSPLQLAHWWLQTRTSITMDEFLTARSQLLGSLPLNIMVAGMLLS